jgi:hypothetical protein
VIFRKEAPAQAGFFFAMEVISEFGVVAMPVTVAAVRLRHSVITGHGLSLLTAFPRGRSQRSLPVLLLTSD